MLGSNPRPLSCQASVGPLSCPPGPFCHFNWASCGLIFFLFLAYQLYLLSFFSSCSRVYSGHLQWIHVHFQEHCPQGCCECVMLTAVLIPSPPCVVAGIDFTNTWGCIVECIVALLFWTEPWSVVLTKKKKSFDFTLSCPSLVLFLSHVGRVSDPIISPLSKEPLNLSCKADFWKQILSISIWGSLDFFWTCEGYFFRVHPENSTEF